MASRVKSKRSQQQRQKATSKSRLVLIWGAVAAGIIGLGILLFLSLRGPIPLRDLVTFARQPRGHDEAQTFTGTLPPAGGVHSPNWQNCGIYDQPIDTENAVHSLEHGAVWITYHPDLSAADVTALQNQVRGEGYLLLSPFPEQSSPIVLTAWEVQLEVKNPSDGRIDEFIDLYRQGPTTPERGATCSDGVGTPIQ